MRFPINFIAGWLVKKGMGESKAGPLAWVLAIIAAAGFAWGVYEAWKAIVIEDARTEERAKEAEKTIEQIETAEGVDAELEQRDDDVIEEMEDLVDEGTRNDPTRDTTAVDGSTSAIHDRMRDDSNARSPR